ncbi:hypothetical protein K2P97_07390 [bacterium]|nr:hypothetical protein [bacterium]
MKNRKTNNGAVGSFVPSFPISKIKHKKNFTVLKKSFRFECQKEKDLDKFLGRNLEEKRDVLISALVPLFCSLSTNLKLQKSLNLNTKNKIELVIGYLFTIGLTFINPEIQKGAGSKYKGSNKNKHLTDSLYLKMNRLIKQLQIFDSLVQVSSSAPPRSKELFLKSKNSFTEAIDIYRQINVYSERHQYNRNEWVSFIDLSKMIGIRQSKAFVDYMLFELQKEKVDVRSNASGYFERARKRISAYKVILPK